VLANHVGLGTLCNSASGVNAGHGNTRILAQIEGRSSGRAKLKRPKIIVGFMGV